MAFAKIFPEGAVPAWKTARKSHNSSDFANNYDHVKITKALLPTFISAMNYLLHNFLFLRGTIVTKAFVVEL